MIISGKNLKKIIQKGIPSVPKKVIAKAICDYITKNKDRIIKIGITQPNYQIDAICSDGSAIRKAITDEIYTITFKPSKEVITKEIKS